MAMDLPPEGLWETVKQDMRELDHTVFKYTQDLFSDARQLFTDERWVPNVPDNTFLDQLLPKEPTTAPQEPELDIMTDSVTGESATEEIGTEEPVNLLDVESFTKGLKADEGIRTEVYPDTEGHLTAGIGHKLTKDELKTLKEGDTVSNEQIESWFAQDSSDAIAHAKSAVADWDSVPSNAKEVLSNMAFQMGKNGLKGFEETLKLVNEGDYAKAATEMLDSKWSKQTPNRAKRMSDLMSGS